MPANSNAATSPRHKDEGARIQRDWELDLLLARGKFAPGALAARSPMELPLSDAERGSDAVQHDCDQIWTVEKSVVAERLAEGLKRRMGSYRRGHIPRAMAALAALDAAEVAAAALRVLLLQTPGQQLQFSSRELTNGWDQSCQSAEDSLDDIDTDEDGEQRAATRSSSSIAGFGDDAYTPRDLRGLDLVDYLPTRNGAAESIGEACEALWRAAGYFSNPDAAAEKLELRCLEGQLPADAWRSVNARDYGREKGAETRHFHARKASGDEEDRMKLRGIFRAMSIPEEVLAVGTIAGSDASELLRRWPRMLIVRVGALVLDALAPQQYRLAPALIERPEAKYRIVSLNELQQMQQNGQEQSDPMFCQLFLDRGDLRWLNAKLMGLNRSRVTLDTSQRPDNLAQNTRKKGGNRTVCIILPLARAVSMAGWFKMIMPANMPALHPRPWTPVSPKQAWQLSRHYEGDPMPAEAAEHVRPGAFRYSGGHELLRNRSLIGPAPDCILTDGEIDPLGEREDELLDVLNRMAQTKWVVDRRCLLVFKALFKGLANPNAAGSFPDRSAEEKQHLVTLCRYLFQVRSDRDRKSINKFLIQAELLEELGQDGFCYFWTMDFRGRLYPCTSFAPRSHDLLRALIVFAKAVDVGQAALDLYVWETARLPGKVDGPISEKDKQVLVAEHFDTFQTIALTTSRNLTSERAGLWLAYSDPTMPLYFFALLQAHRDAMKTEENVPVRLPFYIDAVDSGFLHLDWLTGRNIRELKSAPGDAWKDEIIKHQFLHEGLDLDFMEDFLGSIHQSLNEGDVLHYLRDVRHTLQSAGSTAQDQSIRTRLTHIFVHELKYRFLPGRGDWNRDGLDFVLDNLAREMASRLADGSVRGAAVEVPDADALLDIIYEIQQCAKSILKVWVEHIQEHRRRSASGYLSAEEGPQEFSRRIARTIESCLQDRIEKIEQLSDGYLLSGVGPNHPRTPVEIRSLLELLRRSILPLGRGQVRRSLLRKFGGASRYEIIDQLVSDILPPIPQLGYGRAGAAVRRFSTGAAGSSPVMPANLAYIKLGELCGSRFLSGNDVGGEIHSVQLEFLDENTGEANDGILAIVGADLLDFFETAISEHSGIDELARECGELMSGMKKWAGNCGATAGSFPRLMEWTTPSGMNVVISEPITGPAAGIGYPPSHGTVGQTAIGTGKPDSGAGSSKGSGAAWDVYQDLHPQIDAPVLSEQNGKHRVERYRILRASRSGRTLVPGPKVETDRQGNVPNAADRKWSVEYRLPGHVWHGTVASHALWFLSRIGDFTLGDEGRDNPDDGWKILLPLEESFGIRPDLFRRILAEREEYRQIWAGRFQTVLLQLTEEFYQNVDARAIMRDIFYKSCDAQRILQDAFDRKFGYSHFRYISNDLIEAELPPMLPEQLVPQEAQTGNNDPDGTAGFLF